MTGVGSTEPQDSRLVEKAEQVAKQAYAPYSNYLVGAVVRTTDGTEFVGANVENAAYPLTQCAEKTAIGAASTAGYRPGDIAVVAVSASPCGGCRQWLYEWRVPLVEYRRADGTIAATSAADLLPDSWDLPE
ncbi:MAG TPA: cytidine deaminase [Gaiellaceae bacterium]